MKRWLALGAALTVTAPATAAELAVTVSGVKNAAGQVRLALYDDPETFRDEAKAREVQSLPAQAGNVVFRLDGLEHRPCAIIVYHDEDGNGEMNRYMGMIPTEGYGLSTNPNIYGKPEFAQAAFELSGKRTAIEIGLKY